MFHNKEDFILKANIAKQAQRYKEMAGFMKSAIETGEELSIDERDLFSFAYKSVARARRSSLSIISSIEQRLNGNDRKQSMAREYRGKVEIELRDICYDVLILLNRFLKPRATNDLSKIFYFKMQGDFNRYLAEVETGDKRNNIVDVTEQAYQDAFKTSKAIFGPAHPIRLGLAINFSVFYYKTLNSPETAYLFAQQAYDQASAEMDKLKENIYKDSTDTMQLLRDNMNIWASDIQDYNNLQDATSYNSIIYLQNENSH